MSEPNGGGLRPIVLAALLRIQRKITEGFEGEIHLQITKGGVRSIKWVQTETGDSIKEELG